MATADRTEIGKNEQFKVVFEVNARGRNFKAPDLSNFHVLQGPMRQQSTQIVNFERSESLSFTYLLRPKKVGTFTIGPASIYAEGKSVKSLPLKIKVLEKSPRGSNPNDPYAIAQRNAFMHISTSRTSVYQGEPFVASYKLYFSQGIGIGRFQVEKQPTFRDFYKADIKIKSINAKQEKFKGRNLNMGIIDQKVLIAQRSGNLKPGNLEVLIPTSIPTNKRDRFWGHVINQEVNQTSVAEFPTIKVKPLPSKGKPSDFSGAVGQFKFDVKASRTELNSDESLSLKITLSGKGNIKLVDAPTPEIPNSFEAYDPEYKEKISVNASGMSGTKTWEYLLIPRYGGSYKIEGLTFHYFDPKSKSYKSIKTDDLEIVVSGDANAAATGQGMQAKETEKVNFIGKDILFIKTHSKSFSKIGQSYLGSGLYFGFLILALVLLVGLLAYFFLVSNRKKDFGKIRSQKASKMANKHLATAKKELAANNKEAFYLALSSALTGYLADKFNIPTSKFSKEHVEEILTGQGVAESLAKEVLSLLDRAEMARYVGTSDSTMQSDYSDTEALITKIEEEL